MPQPVWTPLSLTTVGISLVALIASVTSLWFTWRNHLRAEAQEKRRKPALIVDHLNSRILRSPQGKFYCFQVRVRNPTDTDNAISLIEFRVAFSLANGTTLIAKIEQFSPGALFPDVGEPLTAPVKVGAHNIVTGWCVFELRTELVVDKPIERHEVEFHDTQGSVSTVSPRIIQRPDSDFV